MSQEDLLKYVALHYPNHPIMLMTGFEEAFLGISVQGIHKPCAVYDYQKCILILMDVEDLSFMEAMEHLKQITDIDVGDYAPIFVNMLSSFLKDYKLN